MNSKIISILLVTTLLWGCDEAPEAVAPSIDAHAASAPAAGKKEIAWFKGSVDEAFAAAKTTGKPVYLYWGAIWCPPCQEIKHTVFESSEFLAITELFVPVYLDGDTEQAQAMGERFGVKGYPTMIVFNPEGEEVTRIPGGIDISRYNTVLTLALNKMRPTGELIRLATTEPGSLTSDDFTQLAYYSWGQDFKALPKDAPADLMKTLAELAAPVNTIASARLYLQYVVDTKRESTEEKPAHIAGATPWLDKILASDELVLATWDYLAYWPEAMEIMDLTDAERVRLSQQWQDRLLALRQDPSLSTAEQLAGWLPTLYHHFKDSEVPLDDAMRSRMEADLKHADEVTTNAFARQSVVNQMEYLYDMAKMPDAARALLMAELDKSASPYYFMSGLGSLEEKAGNKEAAIDWYRRAYETSKGEATRFQWGASYVRAIIRLAPDRDAAILDTTEALFAELKGEEELFTGRNFRVLRSLNTQLDKWKVEATKDAVARRFVSRLESMCEHQASGSIEKENCESLVSPPVVSDATS